jgi:hypothetical protein
MRGLVPRIHVLIHCTAGHGWPDLVHGFPVHRNRLQRAGIYSRNGRHHRACPGDPRLLSVLTVEALVTWMAGTSPAMTVIDCSCHRNPRIGCIRIFNRTAVNQVRP